MEQKNIETLQDYAQGHFEEAGTIDASTDSYQDQRVEAAWMQNTLLAEIALQLAKQNEALESLNTSIYNIGNLIANWK